MAKVKVFRNVGQRSPSRSLGQKFWHQLKGVTIRNAYVKYENPSCHGSKFMAKVKVFRNVGQRSQSRSLGQKFWYQLKGLTIRNTHVKYESPTCNGSKAMAKVLSNVG